MGGTCSRACPSLFPDESGLNPKLRPPPLVGVLFCLISMFCFICCMVSFRLSEETLFLCLLLVVFYGVLGTGEGTAWERGYPSTMLLVPIGIFSALLPLYIGVKINVRIYTPYHLAVSGRKYKAVPPNGRAAEYADAGIIKFTDDAVLDTSRAFGYKASDFTYCVAPVISNEVSVSPLSSGPKISFWAVGKDCCGNRRDFECDGAGDLEVKNAFTVNDLPKDWLTDLLVPKTSRPMYLKAIEAAKALHNLRSEDANRILLVRWAADPETTLDVWYSRAVAAVVTSCVLYSLTVIVIWVSIHLYFDRDIRMMAGNSGPSKNMASRQVRDPFMLRGGRDAGGP